MSSTKSCILCKKQGNLKSEFCKECDKSICKDEFCEDIQVLKKEKVSPNDRKILNQLEEKVSSIEPQDCEHNFKSSYFENLNKYDKNLDKLVNQRDDLLVKLKKLEPQDQGYEILRNKIKDLEKEKKKIVQNINILNYKKNYKLFKDKFMLYKQDEEFEDIKNNRIDNLLNYIKMDGYMIYIDEYFLINKSKNFSDKVITGFKILTDKQHKLQKFLIQNYQNVPANFGRCFDLLEEITMATKYDYLDEKNLDRIVHLKTYYSLIENGIEPPFSLDMITENGKICMTDCKKQFLNYKCKVKEGKEEKCNLYSKN